MIPKDATGGKTPKPEPPKVLITPAIIRHMAERQRQLEALAERFGGRQ